MRPRSYTTDARGIGPKLVHGRDLGDKGGLWSLSELDCGSAERSQIRRLVGIGTQPTSTLAGCTRQVHKVTTKADSQDNPKKQH
jgi:hypothetical protein